MKKTALVIIAIFCISFVNAQTIGSLKAKFPEGSFAMKDKIFVIEVPTDTTKLYIKQFYEKEKGWFTSDFWTCGDQGAHFNRYTTSKKVVLNLHKNAGDISEKTWIEPSLFKEIEKFLR